MPTYYPFAQTADRLIQVAIRQDGRVQVTQRIRLANGSWPAPNPIPNVFHAPLDAGQPMTITMSVDPLSWGLISISKVEWDPYGYTSTYILGRPAAFAEQIAPDELDYGGGFQNPNPPSYVRALVITVQGSIVRFCDPTAQGGSMLTTFDTSTWFSQHAGQKRACFVLRVSGNNHGQVALENVDPVGFGPFLV